MDPSPRPFHVNISKAARWLGLSERRVRELCLQGALPGAIQPSGYAGTWLVPVRDLEAMVPMPIDPTLVDELVRGRPAASAASQKP